MRIKPSAYSRQDVEDMSAAELRKASLRIVLVDRAYSSPTLPHREVALFSREDVVGCTQTLLFPGGERLLILRASGSFTIYDIRARKTVVDIPPTNAHARSQRSTSTAQLFPTSLYTGHIVIHLSRKWSLLVVFWLYRLIPLPRSTFRIWPGSRRSGGTPRLRIHR